MPGHVRSCRALAAMVIVAAVVSVGACADFGPQDRARSAGAFSSEVATPADPNPSTPQEPSQTTGPPPTGPCVDPDPAVIATCLDATSAVMPGDQRGESTVVAERTTGRIVTSAASRPWSPNAPPAGS